MQVFKQIEEEESAQENVLYYKKGKRKWSTSDTVEKSRHQDQEHGQEAKKCLITRIGKFFKTSGLRGRQKHDSIG